MEITRREVLELNQVLAKGNFVMPISNRFRYMVSKNLNITKKEIDEINAAFPPPKGFPEYQKKKAEILTKYKVKNDADYKELPEKTKESLEDDLSKLDKENKELLEEIKALDKEKEGFLNEKVDLPLVKIKLDFLPDIAPENEFNTWDMWNVLEKIIIEPEETEEKATK